MYIPFSYPGGAVMPTSYTRERIEREFKVERNIIVSPGKYEGAPRFTPYFDDMDPSKSLFTIREQDREHFPELKSYKTVAVTRDQDTGRVSAQAFVTSDYW